MKILPIEDEKMLSDSIKALLGIYDLLILDVMPELPTAATDLAFSLPKGSFRNTKEGSGQWRRRLQHLLHATAGRVVTAEMYFAGRTVVFGARILVCFVKFCTTIQRRTIRIPKKLG